MNDLSPEMEKLTKDEFITYSSPRYYRLVFSDLKPSTKNGDLVSAMNELVHSGFITPRSTWEEINLTKKGKEYKKLIRKLIKENELYTEQSSGLFDYRSIIGRACIVEIIGFLAKKFNFNDYFLSLKLPVFETEIEQEQQEEWEEIVSNQEEDIDLSTEKGQDLLMGFLKNKRSYSEKRQSKNIQKILTQSDRLFTVNLTLIRKLIQDLGMNRPTPLIKHLNSLESRIFIKHGRDLKVDFSKLFSIYEILQESLVDIQQDESIWLKDYFRLLQVPTSLFGFEMSNALSYASKTDAFLNLAIEGPKIFANQFSSINDLGDLQLILFPLNRTETFVISIRDFDMTFYFAVPTSESDITFTANLINIKEIPEVYRTSIRRFGRLLNKGQSFNDSIYTYLEVKYKIEQEELKEELKNAEDKIDRARLKKLIRIKKNEFKLKKIEWQDEKKENDELLEALSEYSASFYTTCQMITKKISPGLNINKCMAVYDNGSITINYIVTNDTLLTTIMSGKPKYGKKLRKIIELIKESMNEILDIAKTEENGG